MYQDRYFGMSPRIARWKINTPFENWLSRRADFSIFWKRIYVAYYKIFDNKYYKGGIVLAKKEINLRKDKFRQYNEEYIIRDMIYCLHRFGFSFLDYCIYELIDRNFFYRTSFVSDKLRYHYCDILNDKSVLPLMTDKYACYKKYKKFFKREVYGCYGESDKDVFLAFAHKHKKFIFKPLEEHSGHGIKIVSADKIALDTFFSEMLDKGPFVIEELIEQGEEIARMHPQSVNSLRVMTFVLGKKVHIIGITWRIGVGDAVIDNAGSGGIYASVDPVNGFVQSDAIDFRGKHFNVHPNTQVQILGYRLPKWNEALSMIEEMATAVRGTTLISWDIAFSVNGWLMVEANDNGGWRVMQSNKMEGKKKELYVYMDEYFKQK